MHSDTFQATEAAQIQAAAAWARRREQDVVVASFEADLARVRRSAKLSTSTLSGNSEKRHVRCDVERKAERGHWG
jgi:hypothetical protein